MNGESGGSKRFAARLVRVADIASDTIEVTFGFDAPFAFKAGQYVWIELPSLAYPDAKGSRRAFSIVSDPSDGTNTIRIAFRQSGSGYKKTLCSLPARSSVSILGPCGSSYALEGDASRPAVFIAGGMGIAPFMSIILHELASGSNRRIALAYTNSSAERAAYEEELQKAASAHPDFRLQTFVGRDSAAFLQAFVAAHAAESAEWYVCGPSGMVDEVGDMLAQARVPESAEHYEETYPRASRAQSVDFAASAMFRQVVLQSSSHIIFTDENGKIKFANKAAEAMTGYSLDEMRDQTPRLWGGLMEPSFYKNLWHTIKEERKSLVAQVNNRKKDGTLYSVLLRISPMLSSEQELIGFLATEEDITERIALERQLKEIVTRDEVLLDHLPVGVFLVDAASGKVLIVNPYGSELLGRGVVAQAGKESYSEAYDVLKEDGSKYPDSELPINIAMSGGREAVKDDLVVRKPDGKMIRVRAVGVPVRNEDGTMVFGIAVFEDITKEKEVDRAKTELISPASHQLRTPLTTLNWYAEMLLSGDAGALTEQQALYVKEIYAASQRMSAIVKSFLYILRLETGQVAMNPVPTDLAIIARSELRGLALAIEKKGLRVVEQYQDALPPFMVDPELVRIVIGNLLSNAVKYTSDKGEVDVSLELKKRGDAAADRTVAQDSFLITVRDTGIGIADEDRGKIFTQFFRTENAKRQEPDGTGLGLYMVRKMARLIGGDIWFSSQLGNGTAFYVLLPQIPLSPSAERL